MDDWTPLSIRETGSESEHYKPIEGVPDWMKPSLLDWVGEQTQWARGDLDGLVIRPLQRRLRDDLGITHIMSDQQAVATFYERLTRDSELFLDVLDFMVGHVVGLNARHRPDMEYERGAEVDRAELAEILRESGSIWTVAGSGQDSHLARRLTPPSQSLAQAAMTAGDRAASHLAAAWRATYGRKPSPQEGYNEAVKAVEAMAQPVVSPQNKLATLGTSIADIRQKPTKWSLVLSHPDAAGQMSVVAQMMELLWKGQHRHGTPDAGAPLANTQEEAECAVQLAMTLVEWFRNGFVRRAG